MTISAKLAIFLAGVAVWAKLHEEVFAWICRTA